MSLRADDLKSAGSFRFFVELDIRTTARHIRRDRDSAVLTGLGDDLSFHLVELGVQYIVLDPLSAKHLGDILGDLDRDRADEDRLALFMRFLNSLNDRLILLFLGLVDRVLMVHTDHRLICGDLNNVHTVDLAEFALFGEGSTGHAALLVEFIEEVLECDRSERLALFFDLYVFLCFDRLVQSVAVASSRHYAACKLIYDQNLVVLYDIVVIPVHQVVRSQSENDAVLDLEVLRIREVGNVEEFLNLGDALCRQIYHLILLIDDKVSGLLSLDAHDRVDLGQILHIFAALHLLCQNIAGLIDLGGLAALSGNDKRRARLVDQDRVYLVDDGVMEFPKNKVLLIDRHVITQVVKTEFVIGDIGDIAAVSLLPLLAAHAVKNNAYG